MISVDTPWGYSVHYFLSAKYGCHPNYSNYLMTKKTLNNRAISELLSKIPDDRKSMFDKKLIEKMYLDYQSKMIDDCGSYDIIRNMLSGKKIMLIGSGPSVKNNELIKKQLEDGNYFCIHINRIKKSYPVDMLFISNSLAWEQSQYEIGSGVSVVNTSNVNVVRDSITLDYNSLLGKYDLDNGGIMCINLLVKIGVKEVYLAGFDGFINNMPDYLSIYSKSYISNGEKDRDEQISKELKELSDKIKIIFLTNSSYKWD